MKFLKVFLAVLLVAAFALCAMGSGESSEKDQGSGAADQAGKSEDSIGKYSVVIDNCRLAEDYEGNPVVIVKYIYTNVSDEDATAFYVAFDDTVYQDGVGLNEAYILDDGANYSADNQTKEIKKGASLEVEVAYELNDATTDIEVEVEELFSFDDTVIKKTFSIAE